MCCLKGFVKVLISLNLIISAIRSEATNSTKETPVKPKENASFKLESVFEELGAFDPDNHRQSFGKC
jgi:hypothetical protein